MGGYEDTGILKKNPELIEKIKKLEDKIEKLEKKIREIYGEEPEDH